MSGGIIMSERRAIGILDRHTAERIAAGEVVDRPMSVVKEVTENSIDSEPSFIFIDLLNGGHELIKIIDNGCGISEEELPLAIKRFATSKITNFDDISDLSTLGFRGEALPSIGAVSRLEIVSKPQAASCANSITVEGGNILDIRPIAGDNGTCVTVTDLFFNTPARKKFQKSTSYELSQITQMLSQIALSKRNIHFRLKNGNKVIFNYPISMSEADCLTQMWGIKDLKILNSFSDSDGEISVRGFVCDPDFNRSSRADIIIFVNGRIVKNNQIAQAVIEGCNPFLPPRRFPCAYIHINLPPSFTDVNVHPSKTEIRFIESNRIYSLIRNAVMHAVKTAKGSEFSFESKTYKDGENNTVNYDRITGEVKPAFAAHSASSFSYKSGHPSKKAIDSYMSAVGYFEDVLSEKKINYEQTEMVVESFVKSSFIPLMQLYNTYIVGNLDGELVLIDQHAAHEKIIYEELSEKSSAKDGASQGLLFSQVLELPLSYVTVLKENLDIFLQLGFDIEEFGGNSFKIRTIPFFIATDELNTFFIDVLDSVIEENILKADEPKEKLRHLVSCKSAVKANKKLSFEEMTAIYDKLITLREPFFCPHGRPVLYKLGIRELEKIFKR